MSSRQPAPVVVGTLLLAACTASPHSHGPSSATADELAPAASAAPVAAQRPVPPCEKVPDSLLRWADVGIISHPGPWLAAVMVKAGETDTGTWYFLAVERGYAYDSGKRAPGHDRAYALTNAVRPGDNDRQLIPIPGGPADSWGAVSWTGERLAAGKAAARHAEDCLSLPRWRTAEGLEPDPMEPTAH